MQRIHAVVRRAAQRDDEDAEAAALQRGDLLRDERFGEARISLEDERDPRLQWIREARAGALAASSIGSSQGATSRETLVSPSSSPGTMTSEGRFCRGSS